MSFFGFGKKKEASLVSSNISAPDMSQTTIRVDLLKKIPNTQEGISLQKSFISLDKSLISLKKKKGYNFDGHKARVAAVMDYSGSMSSLYRNGSVQRTLSRLMPLALKFDDNSELEVWLFEDGFNRLNPMTLNNFDSYVKNEIMAKNYRMGGTCYAPVIKDILNRYFTEDLHSDPNVPVFLIFVTDGENSDKTETNDVIRESSNQNIFIQFVGIGNSSFRYLEKLDDLRGRTLDNTGFIKVKDMDNLDDPALFDLLLNQYPDWLKAKKNFSV